MPLVRLRRRVSRAFQLRRVGLLFLGTDQRPQLHPAGRVLAAGRIRLAVNGNVRQDGDLAAMSWKVADIIANLSTLVRLEAGDLIYTGTPAGVGAIVPGDVLAAAIDGVGTLRARIVPAAG